MVRARQKARAIALQVLYEVDCTGHNAGEVAARLLVDAGLSEENATFAGELVSGVAQNREEIDSNIQKFAPAWPVEQISVIDRNILRLAIFEVLLDNRVPVKVAINEAVEMAKRFGSESSPKFINGVLGSVSNIIHRQKVNQREVESGHSL